MPPSVHLLRDSVPGFSSLALVMGAAGGAGGRAGGVNYFCMIISCTVPCYVRQMKRRTCRLHNTHAVPRPFLCMKKTMKPRNHYRNGKDQVLPGSVSPEIKDFVKTLRKEQYVRTSKAHKYNLFPDFVTLSLPLPILNPARCRCVELIVDICFTDF